MAFDPRALGAQALAENKAYRTKPLSPGLQAVSNALINTGAAIPPPAAAANPNTAPIQNMTGPNARPSTALPLNSGIGGMFSAAKAGAVPMVTTAGASGTPGPTDSGLGKMFLDAKNAGTALKAASGLLPGNAGTASMGQGGPTGSLNGPAIGGLPAGSYGAPPPATPPPPAAPPSQGQPLPKPDWVDRYLSSDSFQNRNTAMNWMKQNKAGTAPNLPAAMGRDFWEFARANQFR